MLEKKVIAEFRTKAAAMNFMAEQISANKFLKDKYHIEKEK